MKYLVTLIVVALIVFVVFYTQSSDNEVDDHRINEGVAAHEIHPGDVAEKIEKGEDFILLDVRTPEEYEEIHLKDALLLPVQKLSQATLNEIGLGEDAKDKEIILYCRSGNRSETAYNIMSSLGYTNIKSSAGGMIHWQEDNYPYTESGPYNGVLIDTGDTATQAEGPQVAIDRKLHDFGTIPQYGGTVEATFRVSNEGSEDLVIGQLTTSCSCTSANIGSQTIAPGDETILTVVFDPDFHEEPLDVFKRTVFIPTNDPSTPEAEVSIQVDILEGE